MVETTHPRLSSRFNDALVFAADAHRCQVRKGFDHVPYISHLLGVAALAIEAGADEDLAIAALLHDAVEDQGGLAMLERIRETFGERVARVVEGCTDSFEEPKSEWRQRKVDYIRHVREQADGDTCLVSAADKLHNARTILDEHFEIGDRVFDRFKHGKSDTLWYYRAIIRAFEAAAVRNRESEFFPGVERLLNALGRVIRELEHRTGAGPAEECTL
jgi:(p)ppGpp synthase/HD superfamily hydrolase